MQTAKNTLSLTSFPWWVWFFPEYTLREKQVIDVVIEKMTHEPEIDLRVAGSIPILLMHKDKQFVAEVTHDELGSFTIVIPESKSEALRKGDHIQVDLVVSRYYTKNRHIAAALH